MRLAIVLALLLAIPLPAFAHSTHQLDAYVEDWTERVEAQGFTWELVTEYLDMMERHPEYSQWTPPSAPRVHRGMGSNVEQWRSLVAAYFPGEVERALCIISHESGGNPNALNPSGASGLFQVMPFWFSEFGGDRFDPENNVRVAALVRAEQGWWAWSPYKRGLCR